jgi:hemerythrin-like domain-containing protein
MLTKIESRKAGEEDAISLLLGCHDRIRHFTEVARKLSDHPGASAADRADAATSVLRYYTVALPLHEADENESIYPRLKVALPEGALADANQQMVEQHARIDVLIAELVPMWQAVKSRPEDQAQINAALEDRIARLQSLWNVHLSLEEEQVVPAMRQYLTAEDLNLIKQEMRERRK